MLNDTNDERKIPLYMKIYQIILSRIEQGKYPENSSLPSEMEFQKEFNVSRITVRRSLKDLEDAGYIKRKRGKLAMVLPKRTYSSLNDAIGFTTAQERLGEHPSSIIIRFCMEPANPMVSEYLQVPLGEEVYYLKRLRLRNGRIIGVHETYIHPAVGYQIRPEDLNENTSLYKLYDSFGIKISYADETIEAKIANKALKQDLFLNEDEPIMYRERITYSAENKPIEYSQNNYRANDYKYFLHLRNTE